MRAVAFDGHGLSVHEWERPCPAPNQAVVEAHASSLNFHEMAFMAERQAPGHVGGNDVAGIVLEAAASGQGPPAGERVLGFVRGGAWADEVNVDVGDLAVLPAEVGFAEAAAVPAAGTTALRAVRKLGSVLAHRVLITGASGGVGRYAVQLAAMSGAHVIAASRRTEGLGELGATEVVSSLDGVAPVRAVIDQVGGDALARALGLLERDGLLMAVGVASRQPTLLDFEPQRVRVSGTRIEAFAVGSEPFGDDLGILATLLASSALDPQIGWTGSLEDTPTAVRELRERRIAGKAVIRVR